MLKAPLVLNGAMILGWLVSSVSFARDVEFTWQNPLPQGNTLYDIQIFSPDTILAVGDAGTVIRTVNGGEMWSVSHYIADISETLFDVHFIDRDTGWVCGGNGLARTVDGGATWERIETEPRSYFTALHFMDSRMGWLGDGGRIRMTTDGGVSWETQVHLMNQVSQIQMVNDSTLWATGGYYGWIPEHKGVIARTTDGGANWSIIPGEYGGGKIFGAHFFDENSGWAVGEHYTVLRLIPPDTTWVSLWRGLPDLSYEGYPRLLSIYFDNRDDGWIVGDYGLILHTDDGGASWERQTSPVGSSLNRVKFWDDRLGWAVGASGTIIKTTDGGRTWIEQSRGGKSHLYCIHFADSENGWAVGEDGLIMHTDNGGRNWVSQSSGVTTYLTAVHALDDKSAVAVGNDCPILRTADGGKSWIEMDGGTNHYLWDLSFPDKRNGWAVGGGGTIYWTTDGGITWQLQESGTTDWLRSVDFIDSAVGWVIGFTGTVFQTTDGGQNWHVISGESWRRSSSDIFFLNREIGWTTGYSSLYFTEDGGKNWGEIEFEPGDSVESIFFSNVRSGWVVGDRGCVRRTNDGGRIWHREKAKSNNGFYSIHFAQNGLGWMAGQGGAIIRIRDYDYDLVSFPSRINLLQNYPNPFNESTVITYALPSSGKVSVRIFNIAGQEVATLADGRQVGGEHRVVWTPRGISSGVYFYRVEFEDYSAVGKCVYLK